MPREIPRCLSPLPATGSGAGGKREACLGRRGIGPAVRRAGAADREGEPLFYRFQGASKMEPRTLASLRSFSGSATFGRAPRTGPPLSFIQRNIANPREKKPKKPQTCRVFRPYPATCGKIRQGYPEGSRGRLRPPRRITSRFHRAERPGGIP